jgi:hypothetical protein
MQLQQVRHLVETDPPIDKSSLVLSFKKELLFLLFLARPLRPRAVRLRAARRALSQCSRLVKAAAQKAYRNFVRSLEHGW